MSPKPAAPPPPSGGWRPTVLVLDDEWSILERIKGSLKEQFEVEVASRAEDAVQIMDRRAFDVVLTDVRMPDMDGLSLVSDLKARYPETQYVLMTAFSDIEDTISAIRLGVSDYLRKPFTMGEVRHALDRCLERRRLKREVASLKAGGHTTFGDIITSGPVMREVCRLADMVAPTDVTVLLSGETGTGKGLMARALHNSSPRRENAYVEINCAAIPTNLIESELFGHERGSFTGAVTRKIGRLEIADGGTLLLDEVGEMPLDMQAKLLRFLQEFAYERVGGIKVLHADVRVIAATNRDLRKEVERGNFREDLYYRLHVIELHLPPLRERRTDLMHLANHFLERFTIKYDRRVMGFSPQAREQIMRHSWPGNVRELEHCVERALILCRGEYIEDLSLAEVPYGGELPTAAAPEPPPSAPPEPFDSQAPDLLTQPFNEYLAACERNYLEQLLAKHKGRVGRTAQELGLNPKTLYLKMTRLGLAKEDFRS
ncbi:MAG: sigma-54 dependent transcriptional regulator [Deltaproteobacteria bacterium]|nr:sigma-54 dependent transcriptional regulator [Deltaproteobacteria bacterium]